MYKIFFNASWIFLTGSPKISILVKKLTKFKTLKDFKTLFASSSSTKLLQIPTRINKQCVIKYLNELLL